MRATIFGAALLASAAFLAVAQAALAQQYGGYGSGYGYAAPFAAGPNSTCGASGCGDLGAAPLTNTGYGYIVPTWPNQPVSGDPSGGGYGYGYGYATPNATCGASGCGDLGAAPVTNTGYGFVPSSPYSPVSWLPSGGYGYGVSGQVTCQYAGQYPGYC